MFSSQSHVCRSSPLRNTYLAHLILLHFLTLTTSAERQLTVQFSLPSCVSSLLGPNTFLSTPQATFSHSCARHSFTPIQIRQCTVLYSLLSTLLYSRQKYKTFAPDGNRRSPNGSRRLPNVPHNFFLFAVLISQCHSQIFKFCHVFIGVTS